ncbi:MAG: DNA-deoxyinosine glycosylase [Caulobacteraceae bacterium]
MQPSAAAPRRYLVIVPGGPGRRPGARPGAAGPLSGPNADARCGRPQVVVCADRRRRHAAPRTRQSARARESLRRSQYYGNPVNQFWKLIGAVLGADVEALDYEGRLAALQAGGVGLWDVVRSARRAGSLDGAIRDHQPNALAELAASLPALRAIAFNGGKASAIGRRELGAGGWALLDLPSSSPGPYDGVRNQAGRGGSRRSPTSNPSDPAAIRNWTLTPAASICPPTQSNPGRVIRRRGRV